MRNALVLLLVACMVLRGHDAHGHSSAPLEARHRKRPLPNPGEHLEAGKAVYQASCAGCHGDDGRSRTRLAGSLPVRPTDLSEYLMESMTEGEIYWVVTHGIAKNMPAFDSSLSETQRWELVVWVRELRARRRAVEVAQLGPYRWDLPPGFPFPNVPADNPMTEQKVELGRYLFYDRRLSGNQTQSCATCHQQERAFADSRGRGLGSTKQMHPRVPMSLANVAYSPVLTWANPNMRRLENQALVPMFGDDPVELGMGGREDILLARLNKQPRYWRLFSQAFPEQADPFTVDNVTKAIASFERTILSGDSPYDRYRRGDDPNAISESAKRGEALFFSERLECFHCHGGFTFTGSVDYYGKGFAEIEFHNTGLYNLSGKFSYPEPNLGLYNFTGNPEDVGKFKAPTLRNIAVTAPYMHDGSIATLSEAIDHYAAGGRKIEIGPNAGDGSANPNKSEFVKAFELSPGEKADLLEFLNSLTDETLLRNPALSNPWSIPVRGHTMTESSYPLTGVVVRVFEQEGTIALYCDPVPGFMGPMKGNSVMEFRIGGGEQVADLSPGQSITATVRRQGRDYVLSEIGLAPHLASP